MDIVRILERMEYGPAPEGEKPVREWLEEHQHTFGLFIAGKWLDPGGDGRLFETCNPATGEILAKLTQAEARDVDEAVSAAKAAFPSWAGLPGHSRARYLYALARQIQKHSRFLAVLESLDNGKVIRETRDFDIPMAARWFYYHAGWAELVAQEYPGYEPLGVVGQIIPWNFPLLMLAWKVAPALAAGNTVVLKPAEQTSLTALAFAELCVEVGLPPGVVNIVTGDGRVGEMIVRHREIAKIAFTGSTEVGRHIRRLTAGSGKRLSLELGGKSPFIVFDDADQASAIEGVVNSIWFNQGEVCCAGSRLLVQESIAQGFLERLRQRMQRLRVGDPLDKGMDYGALVSETQRARVADLVEKGVEQGAEVWQPACRLPERGSYFPPTLLTGVSPANIVAQEEIFGPVLVADTFRTPEEAVELANNTRYGLAASIWTENISLALDVASRVKAGTVWINHANLFDAAAGFGGYRESGFGREGGPEGMIEYLRPTWESASNHKSLPANHEAPAEPAAAAAPPSGGEDESPSDATVTLATDLARFGSVGIDRTAKMYIGGRQVRPDSGYTRHVTDSAGRVVGEVGEGSRKDIRDAVEAAHAAKGWARETAHARAQVVYYIAENLAARADEFASRIAVMTGRGEASAEMEVEAALERLFACAAWADKYEGAVHPVGSKRVYTMAVPEPLGVIGIVCPDEYPLLSLISLVAPAIAMGNTAVVVPSQRYPLVSTDLYQVFDTSDLPGGVVNIVTGESLSLARVLAEHHDVAAVWYFGPPGGREIVEAASAGNLKRTWVEYGRRDWFAIGEGAGREFFRQATQVKNIWMPYGA